MCLYGLALTNKRACESLGTRERITGDEHTPQHLSRAAEFPALPARARCGDREIEEFERAVAGALGFLLVSKFQPVLEPFEFRADVKKPRLNRKSLPPFNSKARMVPHGSGQKCLNNMSSRERDITLGDLPEVPHEFHRLYRPRYRFGRVSSITAQGRRYEP